MGLCQSDERTVNNNNDNADPTEDDYKNEHRESLKNSFNKDERNQVSLYLYPKTQNNKNKKKRMYWKNQQQPSQMTYAMVKQQYVQCVNE